MHAPAHDEPLRARPQASRETRWAVVDRLLAEQPLDPRNRAHRLSGEWSRSWECHIEPDWLLIWHVGENDLVLARTGTHSDLFG